ncbi:DUF748 domain-containing protein [Gillisia hiemivivida]|uniref:DUF748 domain-containing protein n=1 Tax=Gillisia hiemivivida TaxID=291190 RepID=A0A5C6ZYZ9_9FLAO|nr:DUF748 domain-containing protein [Gillisia hiemivivida]TXD94673.1 DUF748 domain-containing protein [Gillisia hiemivivida]
MEKKYKILLYTFIGLAVLLGVVYFANKIVKQKIKAGIEQELLNSNVEYKDISVDIISGSSVVSSPKLKLGSATISSEELSVIDLDYKEYFSNNKIVFDRIVFKKPEIHITQSDTLKDPDKENSKKGFKEDIKIRHLVIQEGHLKISENDTIKEQLYISLKNMDIYDLHITEASLKNKIPFSFREVSINSDSLFYSLDPEHDLQVKNLQLKKGTLNISDLRIIPKFSKTEFDQRQKVEKDRFELNVPRIKMKGFSWGFNGDKLQLESATTFFEKADFLVYRNKLLPDDNSIKPLYSQKLRELETKLKFDTIQISNSSLIYEEKSVAGKPPGKVMFSEMDVTIANVSNLNMEAENFQPTTIKAKAKFMGESNLNFNMEFDISDLEDKFNFSGNLVGISAGAMNSFLKPALNIEVEGKISSMFFNFYGNDDNALGDTRLQYHDFKVEILKKDGYSKNKILSGLANLILKKNVANKKIDQKNISATRDKTKSFWNFLWLCIRNGALKSFL